MRSASDCRCFVLCMWYFVLAISVGLTAAGTAQDLHLIPYYGLPCGNPTLLSRCKITHFNPNTIILKQNFHKLSTNYRCRAWPWPGLQRQRCVGDGSCVSFAETQEPSPCFKNRPRVSQKRLPRGACASSGQPCANVGDAVVDTMNCVPTCYMLRATCYVQRATCNVLLVGVLLA